MAFSRESRALRRSYKIFTSGVDPGLVIKELYTMELLTREEKERATQETLTADKQLDEVHKYMERRVEVDPSVFHTLVQVLLKEPALEEVGKKMQACYNEEQYQGLMSVSCNTPSPPPPKAGIQPPPPLATSTSHPPMSSPSPELKAEATQPQGLPRVRGTTAVLPNPGRVKNVRYEASQLQDQFVSVVYHTQINFARMPVGFLSDLKRALTTLPLSNKFKHLYFLEKKRRAIKRARNTDEIFKILRRHWNYGDYALLQRMVQEFGDKALQNEMTKYVEALERFEKGTTIQGFSQAKPGGHDVPDDISKAVLELNKDPSECTLYEVRQMVELLAMSSGLNEYALFLSKVLVGSVIIELAFPSSALELILPVLKEFLENHQIVSVMIDKKPLEEYTEEYVEGLQLLRASEEGGKATVTSILQSGVNPNFRHCNGWPALHLASGAGHTAVVALLLDHGADVHAVDKYQQQTALHVAGGHGHNETVQLLLEREAGPNRLDRYGRTTLHLASDAGQTAVITLLLDHGVNAHAVDKLWQQTALHVASERGHHETVQLLLERGADPNRLDGRGRTALHLASRAGQTAVTALLLDHGADVHAVTKYLQQTALHKAIQNGHHETVQLLLEREADPNRLDGDRWTALHSASHAGQTAVIVLLLDHGADVHAVDKYRKQTALHMAFERGHHKTVQLLLERGADPNRRDGRGRTAEEAAKEAANRYRALLPDDNIPLDSHPSSLYHSYPSTDLPYWDIHSSALQSPSHHPEETHV